MTFALFLFNNKEKERDETRRDGRSHTHKEQGTVTVTATGGGGTSKQGDPLVLQVQSSELQTVLIVGNAYSKGRGFTVTRCVFLVCTQRDSRAKSNRRAETTDNRKLLLTIE